MATQDDLRLLATLLELRKDLTNHTRFGGIEYLRERKIKYPTYVWRVMQDNKIVEVRGWGRSSTSKWNSIEPNIKMAKKINDSALEISRIYHEQLRENRKKLAKENKSIKTKPNDETKLLNALNEVYKLTNIEYTKVNKGDIFKKYNVSNYTFIGKELKELGVIDVIGKKTKWIGDEPSIYLSKKLLNKTKEKVKIYNDNRNVDKKPEENKIEDINDVVQETEPIQYKKEFKIFGFTIYSTITSEL